VEPAVGSSGPPAWVGTAPSVPSAAGEALSVDLDRAGEAVPCFDPWGCFFGPPDDGDPLGDPVGDTELDDRVEPGAFEGLDP
jgi:hypothetical protein